MNTIGVLLVCVLLRMSAESSVNGAVMQFSEVDLPNIVETAERLKLNKLVSGVMSTSVLATFITRGNYTLFAPTDTAFSELGFIPTSSQLRDVVMAHIVQRYVPSSRLDNGALLNTAKRNAQIRINEYNVRNRVLTANCQPVTSVDNKASNGIINVVPRVLLPVTRNMMEIIDSMSGFTTLRDVLLKTGLDRELMSRRVAFTLLAPSNAAFSRVDSAKLNAILANPAMLKNVLLGHVLPNVICSSAIQADVTTVDVSDNDVSFQVSVSGAITVQDTASVRRTDIMATNGVIHTIDNVLLPECGEDVVAVATKNGATQFLELVRVAGLTKTVRSLNDVTIFVPTNEAVDKQHRNGMMYRVTRDQKALGKKLKYHVVKGDVSRDEMTRQSSDVMDTLDENNKLRINKYESYPYARETVYTAQCVRIEKMDLRACNAKIYLVNQVLAPPRGDVVDILSTDSRFTTLVSLLKSAGLADSLQLTGPFTVFAPTNQAFQRLGSQIIQSISRRSEVDRLRRILQHHVTYGFICCAGIFENRYRRGTRMLDGTDALLSSRGGEVMVDNVRVTLCDQTATNGVVHAIGNVLPEAIERYVTGRRNSAYYYGYYRDYRG